MSPVPALTVAEFTHTAVFIGCGDGAELEGLAGDPARLLIGLEPIEVLYRAAVRRLAHRSNVHLLRCRIQDWPAPGYRGRVDEVNAVFPTPEVLRRQAEQIVRKVCFLLPGGGRFRIWTEVTLSGWPEVADRQGLWTLLRVLDSEPRLAVSAREISWAQLPPFAQHTHCGRRFAARSIRAFTTVEAVLSVEAS